MNDIQFEVITDLAALNPQHIETNFEDVRDWLSTVTRPYATLVVTEDAISDAKKDLAKLRKVKEQIEVQRKVVKKEWMKPYEEFERDKTKVLTGILDEAISNINGQVKAFDEKRREEKLARLEDFFLENLYGNHLEAFLTWNDVLDQRWGNATFDEDEAKALIEDRFRQTKADLDAIRDLDSPFETEMLDDYAHTHDLRGVLQKNTRLKMREEAERREKERKAAETFDEPENAADGFDANPAPVQAPQFIRPMEEDAKQRPVKTYTLSFEVIVTMQQAHALKDFFLEQGIEYRKI